MGSTTPGASLRNTIREDFVDLRDQPYVPSLAVLAERLQLRDALMVGRGGGAQPVFGVRDQGASGRCAGFALANLIDLQRALQRLPGPAGGRGVSIDDDIVSADMLYHMAYFHDRYPDLDAERDPGQEGLRSLRSAIKGFYHHGVCFDWPHNAACEDKARWQSECYFALQTRQIYPSVEQAKTARGTGLGAYCRLASVLNHFHAALNDAEAVLVSARIHDGWQALSDPAKGGVIPPPVGEDRGNHAFVIVGYDERGFHVLNSWGPGWGGYPRAGGRLHGLPQAGIALWPYEDWAENVLDAWVLRLGVRAPSAFGAGIGEKGMKGVLSGAVQAGSQPCFDLMGHYIHLDDGRHVGTGSYPSFHTGWKTTRDYLAGKLHPQEEGAWKGILVWIPGSLEGIKPAFAAAVQRKSRIKAAGLYPYNLFWCNAFVEKSMEVLQGLFDDCAAQAGQNGAHLDALIESRVSGVGRAFWRDIEFGARRAVLGPGEMPGDPGDRRRRPGDPKGVLHGFFDDVLTLAAETGTELHLVAEGAGVLVLHELLLGMDGNGLAGRLRDGLSSLHLVHPAIDMTRAARRIVPQLSRMNARIGSDRRAGAAGWPEGLSPLVPGDPVRPATLVTPSPDLEKRVVFGAYGKSILHLVANAFEDRDPPPPAPAPGPDPGAPDRRPWRPRTFLGTAAVAAEGVLPRGARKAVVQLKRVSGQVHALDKVPQTVLQAEPLVFEHILSTIVRLRDGAGRPEHPA
ncbi:C1 family peptidase [Oceaniglobus roseus]|uniref:C1 family peptidase n=1 Tax=Oceaniglobus roseus TaxID=1737570 RepID=UPI000C7F1B7C|nr:C1 family peptidase [Kandeliimicrobium roseum]